jgi:glycerol-3-phosphate dehydrogenase (NAD(P)+)
VVEGEVNAVSVVDLARKIGVDMPVSRAVHAILHEGADLRRTFADLWARPLVGEPRALDIEMAHPSVVPPPDPASPPVSSPLDTGPKAAE